MLPTFYPLHVNLQNYSEEQCRQNIASRRSVCVYLPVEFWKTDSLFNNDGSCEDPPVFPKNILTLENLKVFHESLGTSLRPLVQLDISDLQCICSNG